MKNRLNQPLPKPPRTLLGSSLTLWRSIQTEYGIADTGGLSVLTAACEAHFRMNQAREMLKREGLTIRDARGQPKPHPAVKIECDCRAQFLSALKQLNLDLEPLENSVGRPAGGKKGRLELVRVK